MKLPDIYEEVCARIRTLAQLERPGPVDLNDPEDNECDQDTLFRELAALRSTLNAFEAFLA